LRARAFRRFKQHEFILLRNPASPRCRVATAVLSQPDS
jgi:hypothetical protein